MQENTSVEHMGIVESFKNNIVRVGFVSHASCSACLAKGACAVSEVDSKFVEVKTANSTWKIGESVTIVLERKLGFKALWFGYVLPLLVLLSGMIITYAITGNDGLAGLVALGVLIPYYSLLYIFREYLTNKFQFTLKKI
ncbi:MAG: SoxR reducing system RseC family protein [Bacteroidales bacterium]|nr:SoxR reducing system RseC family protein [Bacteroidales bacterium]